MKRRQISPLRLRPRKVDADVNRIINHAAKLVMEYNQIKINNIMQSEKDNQEKVNELMQLSNENLPRLISRSRHKRKKKTKVSKRSSKEIVIKDDNDAIVSDRRNNNSPLSLSSEHFSEKEEQLTARSSNEVDPEEIIVESIHTERSEKKSSSRNLTRPLSEKSDILSEEKQVRSNRTMDEVNTFESESSMSNDEIHEADEPLVAEKTSDETFIYDVEIKTGNENNRSLIGDVFLRLNGETMTTTPKLCLKQYLTPNTLNATPFNPGNHDHFEISVPAYLGTINNIIIGLDSPKEDENWFLEYICIKDRYLSKEYRFPCRRWLGTNSADQLSEVKLGYTPSYRQDYHSTKSTSLEDPQIYNESVPPSDWRSRISMSQTNSTELEANDKDGHVIRQHLEKTESNLSVESERVSENEKSVLINKTSGPRDSVLFGKSIHSAIITNDYERVKQLCSSYDELKNSMDDHGYSTIHLAAIHYVDSKIINYLISLTVDPNKKSKDGYTPFLLAVINGNLGSVKYLKEIIKVNCDLRDNEDNTALHLATINGHENIVRYLISDGALPTAENHLHDTPLQIAQRNGDFNLIKALQKITEEDESNSSSESSLEEKTKKITQPIVLNIATVESEKDNKSESIDSITDQADKVVSNVLNKIAVEHVSKNQHPVLHKDSINNKSDSVDAVTDQADHVVSTVLNKIANEHVDHHPHPVLRNDSDNNKSDSLDGITDQADQVVSNILNKIADEQSSQTYSSDSDDLKVTENKESQHLYPTTSLSLSTHSHDAGNVKRSSLNNQENVQIQSELANVEPISLYNDGDYDEDNRGIAFDKRIPATNSNRKNSKNSLTASNLRNVRFNNNNNSLDSARSDEPMSPVTSRSSSPLSTDVSDASSGKVPSKENYAGLRKRNSNAEPVPLTKDKVVEDNEDIGSIPERKEIHYFDNDSRNPKTGEKSFNETESERIRKTNKSPGLEHSV